MTQTEAINLVLTSVGLEALNDSADVEGDYQAASVKNVLDTARKEILTQNIFNFNSHIQTLTADANDEIVIPTGVLRHVFQSSLQNRVIERQRGEPLWDRLNNEKYTDEVKVLLFMDTDFELLPDVIALWVAWRAAELFSFKTGQADSNLVYIRGERIRARMNALNSEYCLTDGMSEFTKVSGAYFRSV